MKNRTFAIGGLLALAAGASAQIMNVNPFTSTYTEGFEEFQNYNVMGQVSSLSMMGGEASAAAAAGQLWVYSPSSGAPFFVGPPVSANVASGVNGLGLYNMNQLVSVTLSFSAPVNYFGGYFADYSGTPANVSFFDAANNPLGIAGVSNGTNLVSWDGWYSLDPISSVMFTGGLATVMDDLVAGNTAQAVPEPGAMAVMGLGVLGLLLRRRK